MSGDFRLFQDNDLQRYGSERYGKHVRAVERIVSSCCKGYEPEVQEIEYMKKALRREGVKFRESEGMLFFEAVSTSNDEPFTVAFAPERYEPFVSYHFIPFNLGIGSHDRSSVDVPELNKELLRLAIGVMERRDEYCRIRYVESEGKFLMSAIAVPSWPSEGLKLPLFDVFANMLERIGTISYHCTRR